MTAVLRLAGRLVVVLALFLAACSGGGGGGSGPAVREQTISDPTTQDILMFRPSGQGSWPIVMAYHGSNGNAEQMAELGRRLAATGLVVFAPNIRTDVSTEQGIVNTANDSECAYRYARSVAAHFGGDLDRPVTFVGWSFGANFALQGGLDEDLDPLAPVRLVLHQRPTTGRDRRPRRVPLRVRGAAVDLPPRPRAVGQSGRAPGASGRLRRHGVPRGAVREDGGGVVGRAATPSSTNCCRGPITSRPCSILAGGDSGTVPSPDSPAGDRTVDLITTAIANDER